MARHAARLALLCLGPLGTPLAAAQHGAWCETGLKRPSLRGDAGSPSVQLFVVQAPLFSRNPSIGNKMGYLRMYHSAVVFVQGDGPTPRNWTLEFDSVTDVVGATLPDIQGDKLAWNNDARYCLTEGILWGEGHWSKLFRPVLQLTADQTGQLFDQLVQPVNSSGHHAKPLYQLWRVVSHDFFFPRVLVGDITCGDGVGWLLHYATTTLGLKLPRDFTYRYTVIQVNAQKVVPVNVSDAGEWAGLIAYFQEMRQLVQKGQGTFSRLTVAWNLMPPKYVYDSNADTYYHIVGNRFPWIWPEYAVAKLRPPPSATALGAEEPAEKALSTGGEAELLV